MNKLIILPALVFALSFNSLAEDTTPKPEATHKAHQHHKHKHGKDCGHKAEQHGNHVDYEDGGHHHKVHGDHYDECTGPEGAAAGAKK